MKTLGICISALFWISGFSQTNVPSTNSPPIYVEKNPIRVAMAAHSDYARCIRDLAQTTASISDVLKKINSINKEDMDRHALKLPPTGRASMIPIYQTQMKNLQDHILSLRREEYSFDKAYAIPKAEFLSDGQIREIRK